MSFTDFGRIANCRLTLTVRIRGARHGAPQNIFPIKQMVVKLRLQRFGRKHLPFYRIVVADSRSPRDGKFIERIGTYNPIPREGVKELTANSERVRYWLTCGAQPSDRVAWLFGQIGLLPAPPVRTRTISAIPRAILKEQASKK